MNKSIKMVALLVLMVSNSCFSIGIFKSVKDIDLKESFGEAFKENAKIIVGFGALGAGVPLVYRVCTNKYKNFKNGNSGYKLFEDTKESTIIGALAGIGFGVLSILCVKKSFQQMLQEIVAKKGKQFVLNLIKN